MSQDILNIFLFIGICLVFYIVFRVMDYNKSSKREGMSNPSSSSSSAPGVAGNAANYAASIKAQTVQMQDAFLISNYNSDYENVIINMSDFVNNQMLQSLLSADLSNPQSITNTLNEITNLYNSQAALNSIMKFLDTI
jgi:hypothetical protein